MTVSVNDRLSGPFAGDGSTLSFAYDFLILANTDLVVKTRTAAGVETTKLLTTNYNVTGVGETAGGTIVFVAGQAPASGTSVIIYGVTPLTQTVTYTESANFPAESHQESIDKIKRDVQENRRDINQAFRAQFGRTGGVLFPEAGKVLGWDDDLEITNLDPTDLDLSLVHSSWDVDESISLVAVKPVATYAELTALVEATGLADNGTFFTKGRTAEEDGGAGFWRYDSGSSATANGGTILAIDGGGVGRFFRLYTGALHAAWFGVYSSATAAANTTALNLAFAAVSDRGHIVLPGVVIPIAGSPTLADKVVRLTGQGIGVTIIRQTTTGGLVFTGSAAADYDMDRLILEDFTMEAGATGANGTAITLTYTGGTGTQGPGPRFNKLEIASQGTGKYWTKCFRASNLRNARFTGCYFLSNGISGATTHGCHLDGDSDPCEVWFDDCAFTNMDKGILIEGTYEGVYLRGVTTVTLARSVAWNATGVQPVFRAIDCYFNDRNRSVELDMVSYFEIIGCTFSSTGSGSGDWKSINLNLTSGSQTAASLITNNIWAGGSGGGTETGIYVQEANAVLIDHNVFYTMDTGIFADANSTGIFIGKQNLFIATTTSYDVVAGAVTFDPLPLGTVEADTNGSTQAIPVSVTTLLAFTRATTNVGSFYDTTNKRYLPPIGRYEVEVGLVLTTNVADGDDFTLSLRKNGSTTVRQITTSASQASVGTVYHTFKFAQTVGTDYWDLVLTIDPGSGSSDRTLNGNAANTFANWEPV